MLAMLGTPIFAGGFLLLLGGSFPTRVLGKFESFIRTDNEVPPVLVDATFHSRNVSACPGTIPSILDSTLANFELSGKDTR